MHNPNPFDFVPFAAHPLLKTAQEYDALGVHLSGYLEVRIKALTPVHIVGYQQPDTDERTSYMYRQGQLACIPAASIRGCLRSFIEALTSGWVSQANEDYPKAYKERHIGFSTFKSYSAPPKNRISPPAVNPEFEPQVRQDKKIDVASYLLGTVIEKDAEGKTKPEAFACKSKVWIEDAFIAEGNISNQFWIPDIKGMAFMGGAKPSASNWWYFQSKAIQRRRVNQHQLMEFVGEKFWGRKFYYHQNPAPCVNYYNKVSGKWRYSPKRDFCRVWLESLKSEASTKPFRIYLDHVPQPLAVLLILSLMPGANIRHKLGYGKAYGYGSIEFAIESARLRIEEDQSRIPLPLSDYLSSVQKWCAIGWDRVELAKHQLDESVIDWSVLDYLAQVLGWQDYDKLLFTYPPFDKRYFAQPISYEDFSSLVNSKSPKVIATQLISIKEPIHFRYYQESADGWQLITRRKP